MLPMNIKPDLLFSFFKKEKAGETLLNEATINDITGDKAIGNDITGDKAIGNDILGNGASASKTVRSEALETETSLPNFRQGDALSFMNVTAIQITLPIKWFSRVILNT